MATQTEPTPATRRQRWVLFCLTHNPNWLDIPLSIGEAGKEIRIRRNRAKNRLSLSK